MFTFKVFSGELKADFDFLKTIKKPNFHHLDLCGLTWQRDYLLVFFNDVVVGIVCFNPNNIRHYESYGIGFINTHKNFRNIGVSKFAIQKFVEYAKSQTIVFPTVPTPRKVTNTSNTSFIKKQKNKV